MTRPVDNTIQGERSQSPPHHPSPVQLDFNSIYGTLGDHGYTEDPNWSYGNISVIIASKPPTNDHVKRRHVDGQGSMVIKRLQIVILRYDWVGQLWIEGMA